MDTLASRGENKVFQESKANALPNNNVYTGGKTQPALKGALPPAAAILIIAFIVFRGLAR